MSVILCAQSAHFGRLDPPRPGLTVLRRGGFFVSPRCVGARGPAPKAGDGRPALNEAGPLRDDVVQGGET